MTSDLPTWLPLSADVPEPELAGSGAEPSAGMHPPPGPGEIQVIAVSAELEASEWVVGAASALARSSGSTPGPLLIDASLERPFLGAPSGSEGISDAFRFGASLSRVLVREAGRPDRIPTGSPVVDPREVLADPGWEVIRERLSTEGRGAYVLVPIGMVGAPGFVKDFERGVLFCSQAEAEMGALRSARPWTAIYGPGIPTAPHSGPEEMVPPPGVGTASDETTPSESDFDWVADSFSSDTDETTPDPISPDEPQPVRPEMELGVRSPENAPLTPVELQASTEPDVGSVDPIEMGEPTGPSVPGQRRDGPAARTPQRKGARKGGSRRTTSGAKRSSSLWFLASLLLLVAVALLLALMGVIELPGVNLGLGPDMPATLATLL